jgi:hypothetical protein
MEFVKELAICCLVFCAAFIASVFSFAFLEFVRLILLKIVHFFVGV